MKRILFVDDDQNVLQGLQRMLRAKHQEWQMDFVTSGQQALQFMDQQPYDVIVSDLQMPGMSGIDLLGQISERMPHVVRIALSGQADRQLTHKMVGMVHQFLWKPCDPDTLKASLMRACSLSDLLENHELQAVVYRLQYLPTLPSLYIQVMDELRSPNTTAERIGEIISHDIGMTAKVLQLVNSAYYGLRQTVSSPAQATALLGLETIQNLVLSLSVFSQFNQAKMAQLKLDGLWDHALSVGYAAKLIAKLESADRKAADYAFIGGLLHDVGKLVMAENFSARYASVVDVSQNQDLATVDAEKQVFGADHAQVGGFLFGLWGLPEPVILAVAYHHHPAAAQEVSFTPLAAVHAANSIAYQNQAKAKFRQPELDEDFLRHIGAAERFPAWHKACQETIFGVKRA